MPGEGRHFATVLFLDIVGSTQIAEELGDGDWHRLLARFRSTVRTELKRYGGHEVDTAGDGFFATFADPLAAIRAADAIARSVQVLGLDVRCGIHAGEVETGGKHVTGMTVHVGARTMALAGPAQVLVTSTIRDMEVGGPVGFEDAGEHELKGVPGTWQVFAVRTVAGRDLPRPSAREQAASRRGAALDERPHRRILLVVAAPLLLTLVIAVIAFTRSSREPVPPRAPMRPVLVRVDLPSRSVAAHIDEVVTGHDDQAEPGTLGGQLVRVFSDGVEFRDMTTGASVARLPLPDRWDAVSIGGQAIWLGTRAGFATAHWVRFDQRTGRRTADVEVPDGVFDTLRWGPGGGWFITGLLALGNVDPTSLDLRTFPTPAAFPIAVPYKAGVWVPDPTNGDLFWFDERTQQMRELAFPQGHVLVVEGPDVYEPKRAYLLDPSTSMIEPLGSGRIETERAFTIAGELPAELADPASSVFFASRIDGRSWVLAFETTQSGELVSSELVGLPLHRGDESASVVIPMPPDFLGKAMLTDPRDHSIWVLECSCGPLG